MIFKLKNKYIKMRIKLKYIIYIIIFIILAIFTINYNNLYKNNIKLKEKNERIVNNLNELNVKNSELNFTTKELTEYIKEMDTSHKIKVDSILKNHEIKIKNLKKLQSIKITIKDTDTIYANFKEPIKIDSLYKKPFTFDKKCINIQGFLYTKDINSKLEINNIEGINNVYISESYKKTFWDVIFFRKGELVKKITSDCGEVENELINTVK